MFILHCTKGKINVIFAKPLEIARWLHGQQKQILFRLLNEFRYSRKTAVIAGQV